jgi:uncharacterized protein (DUF952 family)
MPSGRIYHLLDAEVWDAERRRETVADDQFQRHGFVHCCFREQITEIATWWFDPNLELVAVEVDPQRLTHELRYERSPSRWYPHLYGPIDAVAVTGHHLLERTTDGVTSLPDSLLVDRPPPSFRVTVAGGPTVVWQAGALRGDPAVLERVEQAIAEQRPIELLGGVVVPATVATPYEAYALLETVAGDIVGYEGDGFFREDAA